MKWKTKNSYALFEWPFSFWDQFNWMKVFPLFRTIFGQLVNFFPITLFRQKKKKNSLLSNLVPRVPSFYIRAKSKLKNRVTTVHLLQCKTDLIIRLCFCGRNRSKLKYIHLRKSPLMSEKFVWFVYTCLHSSWVVYNRLVTRLFLEQVFTQSSSIYSIIMY